MNSATTDISFDFLRVTINRKVKVIRTYKINERQIGVVYEVDGKRCSTIVAKRHMTKGNHPRMSKVFRSLGMSVISLEYIDHAGNLRKTSTSRRAV